MNTSHRQVKCSQKALLFINKYYILHFYLMSFLYKIKDIKLLRGLNYICDRSFNFELKKLKE